MMTFAVGGLAAAMAVTGPRLSMCNVDGLKAFRRWFGGTCWFDVAACYLRLSWDATPGGEAWEPLCKRQRLGKPDDVLSCRSRRWALCLSNSPRWQPTPTTWYHCNSTLIGRGEFNGSRMDKWQMLTVTIRIVQRILQSDKWRGENEGAIFAQWMEMSAREPKDGKPVPLSLAGIGRAIPDDEMSGKDEVAR